MAVHPQSHKFLDVRFARVRFYWWRYVSGRREPLLYRPKSFERHMAHLHHLRTIFDCPHANTRPNVKATDGPNIVNPRVCLDCGIGIVTWKRRA